MELTPTEVQCYAGYKAEETPRRFLVAGKWLEVKDILDRWYQGDRDPEWPIADYFKVTAEDGHDYLLKHDRERADWFLADRW